MDEAQSCLILLSRQKEAPERQSRMNSHRQSPWLNDEQGSTQEAQFN